MEQEPEAKRPKSPTAHGGNHPILDSHSKNLETEIVLLLFASFLTFIFPGSLTWLTRIRLHNMSESFQRASSIAPSWCKTFYSLQQLLVTRTKAQLNDMDPLLLLTVSHLWLCGFLTGVILRLFCTEKIICLPCNCLQQIASNVNTLVTVSKYFF